MTDRQKPRNRPTPHQPVVVAAAPQLEALLDDLSRWPAVGVDMESNSLYVYQEHVCLIQLSTPEADYVVDPLNGLDVAPLGRFFADAEVEKVFHAAEYDVMSLRRDYDFSFVNLFDTMWAARVLGWPRVGLGSILEERFGVRSNKRFQRYNWGRRPIKPKALAYAAKDTRYLLPLRDIQLEALAREGRLEEAREGFELIAVSEPNHRSHDPGDVWRVKGVFDLSRREQAVLNGLAAWRDEEARRRDNPHFKILHDTELIALAQAAPCTAEELAGVEEVSSRHARRYGGRILQVIAEGIEAPPPPLPPRPPRRPDAVVDRFESLRLWRKGTAADRGVEPAVILGNATLWDLARRNPGSVDELARIEGFGPWKRGAYGQAVLDVLRNGKG